MQLHEALDELVAVKDELLRLSGLLSKEQQNRLHNAVEFVVDTLTAAGAEPEPEGAAGSETEPTSETK